MQPLISLRVGDPRRVWRPGEQLEVEYQIDAVDPQELLAVEASVLWYTEGKGDEDLSVLYFERRTAGETPADSEEGDLRSLRKVAVTLPNSPLSYQGAIVKVRWCARVRVFLRGGKESFFEVPFQLGAVPRATALAPLPEAAAASREEAKGPSEAGDQRGLDEKAGGSPASAAAEIGAETWLVGSESRLANKERPVRSRAPHGGNGRSEASAPASGRQESDAE